MDAARSVGAVLASDECYGEFGWDAEPVSVLHPDVCGGSLTGLLVLHSLSKRSNMAGYRAGFLAGCAGLLGELLEVRKHSGLMVPGPVQDAMVALLGDHDHVAEQRERYLARRAVLKPALEAAGFRIDHSEGSLYLWATRGEDCRATVDWLAERGILAAPGDFYGPAGRRHVRIALTASDERIAAAPRPADRGCPLRVPGSTKASGPAARIGVTRRTGAWSTDASAASVGLALPGRQPARLGVHVPPPTSTPAARSGGGSRRRSAPPTTAHGSTRPRRSPSSAGG